MPAVEVKAINKLDAQSPFSYSSLSDSSLRAVNTGQETSVIIQSMPAVTIFTDAGSNQGYSYFRFRGIDQTRITVTLDEIPLNEPEDQGIYFSNMPDLLSSASSVQAVRGVGLSQFGVASFGGSLAVETEQVSTESRGELGANWGSFNTFRLFGEYTTPISEEVSLYARLSGIKSDGYKYHAGNEGISGLYKLRYTHNKHRYQLMGVAGRQKNELAWLGVPAEEISADPRTNRNSDEHDRFLQLLQSFRHDYSMNSNWQLSNILYYSYLDGYYDFDLQNFLGEPSTDEMYRYNFNSDWLGVMNTIRYTGKKLEYTAGLNLSTYRRNHVGTEATLGELYNNTGYRKSGSLFNRLNYSFGKFIALADLQLKASSFSYTGMVTFARPRWIFLNPKVGLTYQPDPKLNVYYSLAYTSREPTRTDIFLGNDDLMADEDGQAITGSTEPEHVLDHELGVRLQTNTIGASANLYFMQFQNELVLNGAFGPNALPLTNGVDRSFRTGIEAEVTTQISKAVQFSGNLAYNYSRLRLQGIDFQPVLSPRFIANAQVITRLSRFAVNMGARYQSSSYIDFANRYTLEAFTIVNAGASYKLDRLNLGVQVYNFTNQQYYSHGVLQFNGEPAYFIQAPRNYTLSATWSF